MIWRYQLSAADRHDCRLHQMACDAAMRYPNYTGIEAPARWYAGRAGELAFRAWLDAQAWPYLWHRRSDGKGDGGVDFEVGDMLIDVKCSAHPHAVELQVNDAQRARYGDVTVYVGATLDDTAGLVDLHGWCRPDELDIAGGSGAGKYHGRRLERLHAMDALRAPVFEVEELVS